jgi:membrane fusion protein (multidrug efflux system)
VFVVNGDKAEQRPIDTGLASNGWVEVVAGLKGDERVVVVGQAGLKTGTAVKVVDAGPAEGAPATSAAKAK